MGNIKNFNFNKLDLKLSNSDYWDFIITSDDYNACGAGGGDGAGCGAAVNFNFGKIETFKNSAHTSTTIISLSTWSGAINTGYTFDTFGLTGIDNGYVTFERNTGDTTNQTLVEALTGSTLILENDNKKMFMNKVTGTTEEYDYTTYAVTGATNPFVQFCGGFYQGFYKIDGYDYEVLPVRMNIGWSSEFVLNPNFEEYPGECHNSNSKILNQDFPNNKGFFFYMGTRAENKFWNVWEGADTGCTSTCIVPSGCTDTLSPWCTPIKETDVRIIGDYGIAIPLSPPPVQIDLITNQFLIYGRSTCKPHERLSGDSASFLIDEFGQYIITEKDEKIIVSESTRFLILNNDSTEISSSCGRCGCNPCSSGCDGLGSQTACSYDGKGIVVVKNTKRVTNTQNPFLIYGRAASNKCNCYSCSGESDGLGRDTVCTFSGFTSDITELNNQVDVIDNAIGFRVKDDGSIGYRLLTYTGQCVTASTGVVSYVTGATIEEGYSVPNTVPADMWTHVVIKYESQDYLDDCDLKIAKPRKGRLSFYINSKLIYWVDEFDEFIAKRLNEYKDKQVGVPFNFSLGGGSQGLLESQTFDGLDFNDRGLLIEENFAGTFIGKISKFKFYVCPLSYEGIVEKYGDMWN
jgi:hypothetical protein